MWAMVSKAESMPSSVKSQGYVYMVARMGVVSLFCNRLSRVTHG